MIPLEAIPVRRLAPGSLSLTTTRTVQQDAQGLFVTFNGFAYRAPDLTVFADFQEVEVSFSAASVETVHPRALEVRARCGGAAEEWACDSAAPKRRYPQLRKDNGHED